MRVISKRRLREFGEKYKDAELPLTTWWKTVNADKTDWKNITDVKKTYASADGIKLRPCDVNVVVFNIGGNKYRLVARILYETHRVYIKKVMTHAEYDTGKWKEEICQGLV